ncbi:hypothetical protein [Promicromonospora sp. MEB111]|uniref:hypothetical protein n=1 Tax=Promicromonospora sp. MEB111 TaxID=3040301 RepID=UPI0025512F26|nr:hypothetical protein [Promicromonospora sp. MEB111]
MGTDVWYYLTFSPLAAIMVWAPVTSSPLRFTVVVALCTVGLATLETHHERTVGVRMRRAGRRGIAVLIGVGVVFLGLMITSFALVVAGQAELTLLCAAITFAAMFLGARLYDASVRPEMTPSH